jgi:hypothetical protein
MVEQERKLAVQKELARRRQTSYRGDHLFSCQREQLRIMRAANEQIELIARYSCVAAKRFDAVATTASRPACARRANAAPT